MASTAHPRLHNLLATLALDLTEETTAALERASGVAGSAAQALLALAEFADGTHVGHLAEVLGLTHSGAVRLVSQLETAGLALRRPGTDRRRVEVWLTDLGHQRATTARTARESVANQATHGLNATEAAQLEGLLAKLTEARVRTRLQRRQSGESSAWLCRTCDFTACGRPQGRCPAQTTAAETRTT